MNFGEVIESLRNSNRTYIKRENWEEDNYISLCEGGGFRDGYRTKDFLYLKKDNSIVPWSPTNEDIFAIDWKITK